MALLGISKLDAVNEILQSVGEQPFSALDTTGSSVASMAERVLDQIDRRVQSMGWPENTNFFVQFLPSGAGTIEMGVGVLWVRASGRSRGRELVLRNGFLFDATENTSSFAIGEAVFLDTIIQLDFEWLAPRTKELITIAAATIFQRRWRGSVAQDVYLEQERMLADLIADRIRLGVTLPPVNPYPIAPSVQRRDNAEP